MCSAIAKPAEISPNLKLLVGRKIGFLDWVAAAISVSQPLKVGRPSINQGSDDIWVVACTSVDEFGRTATILCRVGLWGAKTD